jgi:REP element-mobilizing transposase RayT
MTQPRATLISLEATPWYHLVNRCVRRAFLCGTDSVSGQCYEHRRGWIVDRLHQLAGVFAIDVAAYAVMSNHYHLVVRVDAARAGEWSDDEVLRRWTSLFTGPLLVQRYRAGADLLPAERQAVTALAATYRERLADVSWFMRLLNEAIARQANAEDGVKGRFWEGRFKSQALLDEAAILSAMAYVDLNPIRAGMAETPERSEHTSVAERLGELMPQRDSGGAASGVCCFGQGAGLVRNATSAAADALRCHRTAAQRHSLQPRGLSRGGRYHRTLAASRQAGADRGARTAASRAPEHRPRGLHCGFHHTAQTLR